MHVGMLVKKKHTIKETTNEMCFVLVLLQTSVLQ